MEIVVVFIDMIKEPEYSSPRIPLKGLHNHHIRRFEYVASVMESALPSWGMFTCPCRGSYGHQ